MERTDVLTDPATDPRPEGDGHPAVALGVLVAALGLAVLGLALTAVVRPGWNISQWFFAVDTVDAVVYGVVAWLLLSRLRHPVAWILALTAVGGGLAAVGAQWTLLWGEHPDLPALDGLQLMQSTAWVPGTLALIVVVPWLLRDDRLDWPSRVMVGAGVALIAWTVFVRVTDPFAPFGDPLSPLAIRNESWEQFIERSAKWENGLLVALGLVATADVWRRRARQTDPGARRALTWLAVSVLVLSVSFLPLALPDDVSAELPLAFTPLVHLISQALFPAAILGVVLRQRLWGLDLAVRRTLTWWLLTAGLVVAYIVVVAVLGELLPGDDDGFSRVLATALVAAVFQPAHAWVQRGVDALVHGDARRPTAVVRRVGSSLGGAGGVDDLLHGVLEGLVSSLRLGGARIDVAEDTVPARTVAVMGTVDLLRAVELPLLHRGALLGTLWVAPRANERLDGRSLETIEELAPVIAATVALATATDELRVSRARLAEARDEERRTLRRELHDGLGPALAGIGLGLQAARNTIERDPVGTSTLLDRLATELDARVEEVRGLARGLLPPALEELGLAPALVDLAERQQAAGLQVEVDVDELGAVPPPVGSAVYGIVAEAVRNVQRHAAATRCSISARADDGSLTVAVIDDGVGIAAGATPGVGTRSMRERAEGVGGSVTIGPATPRGTAVVVRVPLVEVPPAPSDDPSPTSPPAPTAAPSRTTP
jgi:signal transduction histidine kinase